MLYGARRDGVGFSLPNISVFQLPLDIRFLFAHNRPMAITRRQRELYDFISRFVAEKADTRPPSKKSPKVSG